MEFPTQAVLLILGSAFLHALWNAILKKEKDARLASGGVIAIAGAVATAAAIFAPAPAFSRQAGMAWAAAAGICEAGYFATLSTALLRAPLGLAYSVARGGAIIAVWPVSIAFLDEPVTAASLVGAGLVTLGILALGAEGRRQTVGRGLIWAGFCAAFIAGYHLCYKCALEQGAEPRALFSVSFLVSLPIYLFYLGRPRVLELWPLLKTRMLQLGAAGIICAGSFLLLLWALTLAGAGAVLTLRNTSVLFAQGLAFAMGERIHARQIGGAMLVALGAIIIGWPR